MGTTMPISSRLIFVIVVVFSLLIRIAFIPNPGFEADVSFWKGWGLAAADKGVVWSMHNTNNNYPTPFAYTLAGMVHAYRFLGGNPYNIDEYWSNTNLRFLIVSKLPAIIADYGIALLLIFLARLFNPSKRSDNIGYLLAGLYLLSPISIMDGAWWGQVDSLGVVLFLVAFYFLLTGKPLLTGVFFMVGMMTKLQNMIYGPLLFTFIWTYYGFKPLIYAILGTTMAFFVMNLQFFLAKDMARVIASLVDNYDYFPYMSLHAYNLWWLVSGGNGMGMSDKLLSVGILSAKSVGTLLFSATYLLAGLTVTWPHIKSYLTSKPSLVEKNPLQGAHHFILGLIVVNAGFFLFQTQSHERYAFPLSIFLLLLFPFIPVVKRRLFILGYIVWSVIYFLNLHIAFGYNYEENVFSWLWFMQTPGWTNLISIVQLVFFASFIIAFWRSYGPVPLLTAIAMPIIMMFIGNLNYLQGKPIALSSMTPYISAAGYGARVKDMPTNSGFGPKSWTFLSTQYAFFRKGIGIHANSQLTYDIDKKFNTFETSYGIDTTAGTQASAIYEIWGDDTLLFRSEKMGRFDLPRFVKVSLTGVNELTLKTLDAGDSNRDDHTNWLQPKLYR